MVELTGTQKIRGKAWEDLVDYRQDSLLVGGELMLFRTSYDRWLYQNCQPDSVRRFRIAENAGLPRFEGSPLRREFVLWRDD